MSKIEWTEKTWNPITGCNRVSAGCQHCYAERMTKRLAAMGQEKYQGLLNEHDRFNGVVRFHPDTLDIPLRRKMPTTWFVNSMSDLFHDGVKESWLGQIWQVMAETPQHTYQILTKRAKNLPEWVDKMVESFDVLPNVWLGVSVESQAAADQRIPYLLRTPAAVRFLSCEPLLGPVVMDRYAIGGIDWIIVGGESGPGARPMHPDWARSLRDQCQEAEVPFFFKQWGAWLPVSQSGNGWAAISGEAKITYIGNVPLACVGKKEAGRLLDGQVWNGYPTPPQEAHYRDVAQLAALSNQSQSEES